MEITIGKQGCVTDRVGSIAAERPALADGFEVTQQELCFSWWIINRLEVCILLIFDMLADELIRINLLGPCNLS